MVGVAGSSGGLVEGGVALGEAGAQKAPLRRPATCRSEGVFLEALSPVRRVAGRLAVP
ncbi:hypothetical protein [Nonomuraea lactucae]|uniref:hypothetical protein n=1 Tax=Nonomuraea lactucae TaxID=2249762 RepID=UPI0013B3AAF3|nr:hypothetical protein [Nonomuraea lactucae]